MRSRVVWEIVLFGRSDKYMRSIAIDCDPSHIRDGLHAIEILCGYIETRDKTFPPVAMSRSLGRTNMWFLVGSRITDRRDRGIPCAILGLFWLAVVAIPVVAQQTDIGWPRTVQSNNETI